MVVTFGEVLLRLSPPGFQRLEQTDTLRLHAGGAEANAAVALARWGVPSRFVSRLPTNALGRQALGELRRHGVDTQHVGFGPGRLGLYFYEHGAGARPPTVLYDRAHSSITTLKPGEVDWDAALDGAAWLLTTGITAALGPNVLAVVNEALAAARRRGVRVAMDLNYRAALWSPQEAQAALLPLMAFVDVCFAGREDAQQCLGFAAEDVGEHADAQVLLAAYDDLARRLIDRFGFDTVALTVRQSHSAARNAWQALARTADGAAATSARYALEIVDRVGGGDAFSAGMLRGLVLHGPRPNEAELAETLAFAAAASVLQQTTEGDASLSSVAEIDALARGHASGRVVR